MWPSPYHLDSTPVSALTGVLMQRRALAALSVSMLPYVLISLWVEPCCLMRCGVLQFCWGLWRG